MMMLNDEVNILRQVPLFASIDPSRLKKLAFSSHRQHFVAGEELFHQGDDADHAYIIISGNASVMTDGADGPTRIAEIPAGNIVGEIALLCGGSRRATVRTGSSSTSAIRRHDALPLTCSASVIRSARGSSTSTGRVTPLLVLQFSQPCQLFAGAGAGSPRRRPRLRPGSSRRSCSYAPRARAAACSTGRLWAR